MNNSIPEKIAQFNVYAENEKLIGLSGEITLPSLEPITETISGAGIAGEYESAVPGQFGSMSIEIPFKTLYDAAFNLFTPKGQTIVLRASEQSYLPGSGQIVFKGLKITLKVIPKGLDLGKLAIYKPTETKNTLEVLYIKIERDGKELLELDKLNFIFKLNGEDILKDIRNQI